MILFDLIPGRDEERHPVSQIRLSHFSGGPLPDFLPAWEETDRLEIEVDWSLRSGLSPRDALGAIDGFFRRHARWRGDRVYCSISASSPGRWSQVCKLYSMFGKPRPWRLKRFAVPAWAIEEVRLERTG